MTLTPDSLLALLATHEIAHETFSHPPLHTVAESKALRGVIPGAQTKNLFLRDTKKNAYLVTLAEDAVVNLKSLREPLGSRGSLSFASPEMLEDYLGVQPGAVTLLALANDVQGRVKVGIDAALMMAQAVGCHPLTNERTTVLTPQALTAFLTMTGHKPVLLEVATAHEDAPAGG